MPQVRRLLCVALSMCALVSVQQAFAEDAAPAPRTMDEILAAAPATDWRKPDPQNLLVMQLAQGTVLMELAPDYAPQHSANLRTLAEEAYFDGLTINRSQDNFVVQWGDANGEDAAKKKSLGTAKAALPAEFSTAIRDDLAFTRIPDSDGWAPEVGFSLGFPAARDPATGQQWLAHCYAMVGAGRGNAPDSSNGTELYVVIGQSPRQLDLNITLVGRVLSGMEHLSTLPRSLAAGGFYERPEQRVAIQRLALASKLPESERPMVEVLRTDSVTFNALIEARRNRSDAWYLRKAGHIDLCNVPLPVRNSPENR
jgi:peptidylprolyl isomerase